MRPEDVVVGGQGAVAEVVRIIPRGHFTEALLAVTGTDQVLHAYLDSGALLDEGAKTTVRFRRALVYRDGVLL